VDGDALGVTAASDPAHGSAVINSDGTITYTPDADYHGSDSFTYAIDDGNGGTDAATVNVNVNSVNDAPEAANDTALADEDAAVTIGVLSNDSDVDGDTLTVMAVTQPASGYGSVTINADGTLTYTQIVFANGTETFTYAISDGQGGTATATVTVTVRLSAKIGIESLLDEVKSSDLSRGRKKSLVAKLSAAQQSLNKGNARAAVNQLNAFANQVRALKRNHTLAADAADLWLFEVENISAAVPRPTIGNLQMTTFTLARRVR
jgi:VCBS repeat-containing protein